MSTVPPAGKELIEFANKNPHIRVPYASLGWVADRLHKSGYHCGWDIIGNNQGWGDYSLKHWRDQNGVKMDWNAASGFDITTNWALHDQWLKFLTDAFMRHEGWTRDIREIIGSFDGVTWYGWVTRLDTTRYRSSANSYSDSSHRWHTHVSYFRDALHRSKLSTFTNFLAWKFPPPPPPPPKDNDMDVNDPNFQALIWRVEGLVNGRTVREHGPWPGEVIQPNVELKALKEQTAQLANVVASLAEKVANFSPVTDSQAAAQAERIATRLIEDPNNDLDAGSLEAIRTVVQEEMTSLTLRATTS